MQKEMRWTLMILSLLAMGSTYAADETGMWYINPQIGYTTVDPARLVKDDLHGVLGIGGHFSEMFSGEFNASYGDFSGDNNRKLYYSTYTFDGLIVFNRPQPVSPYITLGGGLAEAYNPAELHQSGAVVQGGLGVMFDALTNSDKSFLLQIRPEVKYRYDWANRDGHPTFHDWLFNLGFALNFGAPHVAPPPPVAQRPLPPPPPPPRPVGPIDSDGDGVPDSIDQCPGTPPGVAVNEVGCPRTEPVILRGVTFNIDSATLTPTSGPILDAVVRDLKEHPRVKVELQGHTDSSGSPEHNMQLSQERAESVRSYIMSKGISGDRLVAKGYGETKPIADNSTEAGRSENRRVVMAILENPGEAVIQHSESNK